MANRRVPKFSLNNCAQSSEKKIMCPKFCTNPVYQIYAIKVYQMPHFHKFVEFSKATFTTRYRIAYCQNLLALAPTNRQFAEKNRLSGNTAGRPTILLWGLVTYR